jgi:energy-converting hydrogenase A subunit R
MSVQLNTDCEGPLCLNDNAFEVCARFLPDGARFFTQLSRYDDYLADVVRRPGYEAGSTLKLIAPFLKAFGLTDAAMVAFSRESVHLVPGAEEEFAAVRASGMIPAFIVSTSYEQFARAVAERLRVRASDVYCSPFALDQVSLPVPEARQLRTLAAHIVDGPSIDLPEDGVLSQSSLSAIGFLEDVFRRRLPAMKARALIRSVRLVGAKGKAHAVRDSLKRTGNRLADVVYVGDSITDVKAFDLVREHGGLSVAFNGNRYAVDAADVACAAEDAVATSILVDVFARRGKPAALDLAARWPAGTAAQLDLLAEFDVSAAVRDRLASLPGGGIHISDMTRAEIRERSAQMRVRLRGEHVGTLG